MFQGFGSVNSTVSDDHVRAFDDEHFGQKGNMSTTGIGDHNKLASNTVIFLAAEEVSCDFETLQSRPAIGDCKKSFYDIVSLCSLCMKNIAL